MTPVSIDLVPVFVYSGPTDRASAGDRRRRVLVADDDEQVRTLVTRMLRLSGCEVVAVADGAEAVEAALASERPFDVVILDIFMPGRNGVKAYWEISRRHGGARFLFTSAYYESALLNDALREGRSAFLAKPFLPGYVLEEVQSLIAVGAGPARPETGGAQSSLIA